MYFIFKPLKGIIYCWIFLKLILKAAISNNFPLTFFFCFRNVIKCFEFQAMKEALKYLLLTRLIINIANVNLK